MPPARALTCLLSFALLGCDDKPPASAKPKASDQPQSGATEPGPDKDAPASVTKASFDLDHAFKNPSGELNLAGGTLSLTLRAELDAPIELSTPYPKAEKSAQFEYETKDGKVGIKGHEFDAKLESSSLAADRKAFVIPIDAPGLDRSATAGVADIVFWTVEASGSEVGGLKPLCGTEVEVRGTATITAPRVATVSDLIVYDGDEELPVELTATLPLGCE